MQRDLLAAFFEREQRLVLTGGGALAGFYFGHRETEDLDLFAAPGVDLDEPARALEDAATACGAAIRSMQVYQDFRRFLASRGGEECIVDLVVDRAPMVDAVKATFGRVRVDTLREIAANKICTVLSRSEIKDLVDLAQIVEAGVDLDRAFDDAEKKDRGADPATLAWIVDDITIEPDAALPGGVDVARLIAFRDAFAAKLRAMAFDRAQRRPS